MRRREFLKALGVAGAPAALAATPRPPQAAAASESDRTVWLTVLRRLADPVLTNLANETLKARMPVEEASGANRRNVTHLEALGRLIAGMAPWIELPANDSAEGRVRARYVDLARRAIDRAVDPASRDFLNFTNERQPLVDAAFLAQGILRAPRVLNETLDAKSKRNLIAALESTRTISPGFNNWLLFSATVEAALARLGSKWDRMRVDYALRQHDQWYKGDGAYGDGPEFHWDYYNSFVIHPMLIDVLAAVREEMPAWKTLAERVEVRARRYAGVLERLVAPDGSFPAIGRSLAYRCGAFHLLAQAALHRRLPEDVTSRTGSRRADRGHQEVDVAARDLRCRGLAANRLLRPSAGHRRALHLNRQSVSLRRRPVAAWLARIGRILGGPAATVDIGAGMVRT